ncbi:MAG: TRAP transporter large permease [Dehalococcoidia bacterium]|nr:TRAP transporter large permease [Dehalococcoidia bacterium]
MSPIIAGIAGIVVLFILMFLNVNIGLALALVGFLGVVYLGGLNSGLSIMGISPITAATSYNMSVIPLFVLMGTFVVQSQLGSELYNATYRWVGHLPGGLAMATAGACAFFASVSGSSAATAAAVGTVSLPEMKRYRYDAALATGCVASSGTLGILIPPSMTFVIYGMLTSESIGKLLIAGVIPGILLAIMFMLLIYIFARLNPVLGPRGPKASIRERITALKDVWGIVALFVLVIGGIYFGIFTPTEAAGIGAFGAFLFTLGRKRLTLKKFWFAIIDAVQTTSMIMIIVIGATVFGYFLAMSKLPLEMADFVARSNLPPYIVLTGVVIVFVILGCFIEALAMLILVIPIVFPLITNSGFDPIWFGVIAVIVTQIALITPPVGVNVFVIKGIANDVPMYTIFRGVTPYVVALVIFIVILTVFPQIALFLPNIMK